MHSRARQILTGLTALLALLALLAGAPVGLALLGGNPLPDRLPTWQQLGAVLTRPDDGSLLIPVLTIIGWLAWAAFILPILVEAGARLRGVRTPRLPALGGPQKIAAGLLTGVSLLVASPAVAAATPAQAAPTPTVWAVPAAHTVTTPAVQAQPAGPAHPQHATYKVRTGDYLSAISQRALGDADRYPELARLNRIPDADLIRPGQVVRLPADAHDHGARRHATGHLTAARTAPPADAPSADAPSAGPTASSTAHPPTPAPAATAPAPAAADPTAGTTGGGRADTAAAAASADPERQDTDRSDLILPAAGAMTGMGLLAGLLLTALHRRRARQQQHRRPRRRIAQPVDARTESRLRLAATGTDLDRLDAGLRALAAGLAERADERWPDIVAAWLRPDGFHLVLTEPCPVGLPQPWLADGPTIWTLPAAAALPDAADQLAPLPTLVGIASHEHQHLLVDLERLGLLSIGGDPERGLDLLRYIAGELANNRWSDDVYVTVAGFADEQARLLAQLNPDRVTIAESGPSAIARLRRQLSDTHHALQAAGTATAAKGRATDSGEAWPPHVLLLAHPDAATAAALADLDEQLAHTPSANYAVVVADPTARHGRWPVTVSAEGGLQVPFLSDAPLTAAALPAAMLAPVADLLRSAADLHDQDTPPAADTETWAAGTDAAGGLSDMLEVDEAHREETSAPVTMPVHIHTRAAAEPATDAAASEPIRLAEPAAAPDPAVLEQRRRDREHRDPHLDDDLQAWAAAASGRPRIAILGPVEINADGLRPPNRTHFYGELIVYLAARGARGATAAQLEDAIWRDQEPNPTTRRAAISRARTWLGDSTDGGKWMPQMGGDQVYRIADGYQFDWHLFRRFRARGESRGAAGAGDLRQALEFVRGAPLAGVHDVYTADRAAYAWLPDSEITPTHLVAAVADTAHQLIQLYLDAGDLAGARWALDKAWLADPDRHEIQPWRDAMRIAHLDGRDSELRALVQDLLHHRDAEIYEDLDPQTYGLVQRLLAQPHTTAS